MKEDEQKPDFSNSAYLFPHINGEGIKFGVIALCLCVLAISFASMFGGSWGCKISLFLALPLLLLVYGVFLFFRDPVRYPPEDPKAILSPADGRVCLIREIPLPEELGRGGEDKYWCVSVFMSVFNVHVNRMPFAGEFIRKVYVPGKFLNASLDKASKDNERCVYLVRAENGAEYGIVQIAGLVARRIVPFVKEGDKCERAERFGLIRFGSRLDVYLPKGVKPEVRLGQIMNSGETVLGRFA